MTALVRYAFVLVLSLGPFAGAAVAAGGGDSTPAAKQDRTYVRAKTLIEVGDYAAALPLLQQVVAADPDNADAYNYLGYSHRRLGDPDAALRHYQRALALEPEHRGANEYLGELYLEMGALDKAKERLKVLDGACFFGCEEYRELKAAIEAYERKADS